MNHADRLALVAQTLADFRTLRAEYVATIASPAAAELVLYFRKAGLAVNAEQRGPNGSDACGCSPIRASVVRRNATATNGAGEQAEVMTRGEACALSLANLDAVIATLEKQA